jgi:mRNA interferase MazF
MTGYEFGDIVVVPFPFTDQSAVKRRPAVVVSSSAYHRARPDLLIMAVTSQQPSTLTVGEVQVQDWKSAGLLKSSVLKPVLTTIEPALVLQKARAIDAARSSGPSTGPHCHVGIITHIRKEPRC